MYEMASDPQYKDELGKEEIRIENELEMLERRSKRQVLWENQNFWTFPQCRLLRNPMHISIRFCFIKRKKSIPCLGNKYYNKAIDNRN